MAQIAHPPEPLADVWDWQHQGSCRAVSPELFFHPEGERGSARQRRDERAKALCAQCPVVLACREHALAAHEPYGVWGGLTEDERLAEIQRRERPAAVRLATV